MRGRFLVLAIVAALGLASCGEPKKATDIAVTLLLHTNEGDPVATGKLTLILDGERHTVTTGSSGHASFMAHAEIERRLQWMPVGMTPFSWPTLADFLPVTAEFDHSVRIDGREVHYPVLYKLAILRLAHGDCLNPGPQVFGPDASGEFTIDLDRPNIGIPLAGKMVHAPNNGYRIVGLYGDPATEKPLKLDLDIVQEHWSQAE